MNERDDDDGGKFDLRKFSQLMLGITFRLWRRRRQRVYSFYDSIAFKRTPSIQSMSLLSLMMKAKVIFHANDSQSLWVVYLITIYKRHPSNDFNKFLFQILLAHIRCCGNLLMKRRCDAPLSHTQLWIIFIVLFCTR